MKQNSNKAHIVISVSDDGKGLEINEDVAGTLPQLTTLLTCYIVHFCQTMAKKEQTIDGHTFSAKHILTGIIIASIHGIEEELDD